MKDKFFLGALAGTAGSTVMLTLYFILNSLPGISIKLLDGIARVFVPEPVIGTLEGNIIGIIAHFMCGSMIGLAILVIFEITGYNNPLLKGAALGAGSWFIACGIVGRLININIQDNFIDQMLNLLIHIPYGITVAWFLNRYKYKEIK
jgi:hypothetical protein